MRSKHVDWFVEAEKIITNENKVALILEFAHITDDDILNNWAKYFRSHYCSDDEIDLLRGSYSRQEYLENIKFPNKTEKLGCATRSGDFCEILVADYIEYVLNYVVPRTRYDRKTVRNESTKGCDILGFRVKDKISVNDELIICEVKGQLPNSNPVNRLQDAVNDSRKDITRIAESLNAMNQRLIDKRDLSKAEIVQRFQNSTDTTYKIKFAAAAVHSNYSFSEDLIKDVSTKSHIQPNLFLLVIKGDKFMDLAHELYRRASIC